MLSVTACGDVRPTQIITKSLLSSEEFRKMYYFDLKFTILYHPLPHFKVELSSYAYEWYCSVQGNICLYHDISIARSYRVFWAVIVTRKNLSSQFRHVSLIFEKKILHFETLKLVLQILTTKVHPRARKVKIFLIAVDP